MPWRRRCAWSVGGLAAMRSSTCSRSCLATPSVANVPYKPTSQAYFDRLTPVAAPFMALFERGSLPHRASLSRFLAAVDGPGVEALRALFVSSSLTWGWTHETIGGLWDRTGRRYLVFDIDGTREAARQRALARMPTLPPPKRRLDDVCAPGYMCPRL